MMLSASRSRCARSPSSGLLVALALLTLAGPGAALAQPRIVVSIHPYFDLTQRIAGPDATVVRLLPPGASPHGFDPTPSVVAEVERADLVVLNGGVDAWVLELVQAGAGAPAVLELLPLFPRLDALVAAEESGADAHGRADEAHEEQGDSEEHADAEHEEHGGVNAHIWLDPVLMADAATAIGERLAELDPERGDAYRRNAAVVAAELRALHAELASILEPVRGAAFVPFHDAWPYFAARYGLDLVIEIEPFPGREPGPRYLAEVVAAIRESGARAVFAEAQLGERPARVIAAEAGVDVAVLDPVGGTDGTRTYEELLRYNARAIVAALGEP